MALKIMQINFSVSIKMPPKQLKNAEDPKADDPIAEDPKAHDPIAEDPKADNPIAEDPKADNEAVGKKPAGPVTRSQTVMKRFEN
jgi:hypothetical protein